MYIYFCFWLFSFLFGWSAWILSYLLTEICMLIWFFCLGTNFQYCDGFCVFVCGNTGSCKCLEMGHESWLVWAVWILHWIQFWLLQPVLVLFYMIQFVSWKLNKIFFAMDVKFHFLISTSDLDCFVKFGYKQTDFSLIFKYVQQFPGLFISNWWIVD